MAEYRTLIYGVGVMLLFLCSIEILYITDEFLNPYLSW